jgi:arylsulfatase A-like enzyme
LERTQRGNFDGRSPDVTMVPKAPNFTGSFGFTTHAGPWPYVQRVPLVLYGPGFIESRGEVRLDRDVDLADLPSTLAELLDTPLPQGAGSPIEEVLVPPDQRSEDLKLIVTVVWDGGGWNVLNRYPNAWPNLNTLMQRGTSLRNVMVGSSPSTTPAVHSTIGTGAWPSKHGAVDIPMRKDGEMVASFEGFSADDVLLPTLADLYDQATGNKAKVGMVAERPWHLGMLGHGASLEGGDKDIAVLWNLETRACYESGLLSDSLLSGCASDS